MQSAKKKQICLSFLCNLYIFVLFPNFAKFLYKISLSFLIFLCTLTICYVILLWRNIFPSLPFHLNFKSKPTYFPYKNSHPNPSDCASLPPVRSHKTVLSCRNTISVFSLSFCTIYTQYIAPTTTNRA